MAHLSVKVPESCATAPDSAMVGMVISGRAARACDVCGTERARWYCAADLAYLCQHCDGAVHSANAVAGRHERVRLGPNGKPAKVVQASTLDAEVKQEASGAHPSCPHPASSHFNPRKRPRSIRRHKLSSLHASKRALSSSIHSSSHMCTPSLVSECNHYMGSILAATHGIMIDNPRSSPDFIINISGDESLTKSFAVKIEPYSPVDVGDQVKVPDHLDGEDQLLESLFDFRDLQDDDHFLHQVPVYNPLQYSQKISPTPSTAEAQQDHEEEKRMIEFTISSVSASAESNRCVKAQSSELFEVEESDSVSRVGCAEDVPATALPLPHCNSSVEELEPTADVCDLDQLDFDCVLEGNDENNDEMSHVASMDMDANSHDYLGAYSDQTTDVDDGSYACVSHESCTEHRADHANAQYDDQHCASSLTGVSFDASVLESPCTWPCKVEPVNLSELGIDSSAQSSLGSEHNEALLKEKLTCRTFSVDASRFDFRLGLDLNLEDVLSTWADRGCFWMDGHPPSHVANCLDFLGGYFVPHTNGSSSAAEGSSQQLLPTFNFKNKGGDGGAREASVLRYREKRHTRLFSKKIRYEVRKLNAEKRPRMKGRFVKRIAI